MHVPPPRRALAAAFATVLAACGGGGTDTGVVDPNGGGTGGLSVSVDRTSLEFYAMSGATPSSQQVRFTLQNGTGTYYGAVVPDRASFFDASVSITGPTTATATLTPRSPPPGTTTGTMTFKLCRDAACGTVDWSTTLPYTVTTFEVTATRRSRSPRSRAPRRPRRRSR